MIYCKNIVKNIVDVTLLFLKIQKTCEFFLKLLFVEPNKLDCIRSCYFEVVRSFR